MLTQKAGSLILGEGAFYTKSSYTLNWAQRLPGF